MEPKYIEVTKKHFVACHLYNQEIMDDLAFYDAEYDQILLQEQQMKEQKEKKNEKK